MATPLNESAEIDVHYEDYKNVNFRREEFIADSSVPARLINVYEFWLKRGYFNLVLARALNLLALAFTLAIVFFLAFCLDYVSMFVTYDFVSSIRSPIVRTLSEQVLMALWCVFIVVWLYEIFKLFSLMKTHAETRNFYETKLKISAEQITAISWDEVLQRLLTPELKATINSDSDAVQVDELTIVNIIMRKENYLIALMNKNVLKLSLPFPKRRFLTKAMEWALKFALFDYVFTSSGSIRAEIRDKSRSEHEAARLKTRFVGYGVLFLLISPFILIGVLVYFFLKYGEQMKNSPGDILKRNWSPVAKWIFRDFNELPHQFDERIRRSYAPTQRYVDQWSSHTTVLVAKFFSFLLGAIVILIIIGSIYDDQFLLRMHFFGRSAALMIVIVGAILAAVRQLIPDRRLQKEDTKALIMQMAACLHSLPDEWVNAPESRKVYEEIIALYTLTPVLWLEEFVSFLVVPFILIFSLPRCTDAIVNFFQEKTVDVKGIGPICNYANFEIGKINVTKFGNHSFILPFDSMPEQKVQSDSDVVALDDTRISIDPQDGGASKTDPLIHDDQSDDGKMEMSLIHFAMKNKNWKPADKDGRLQFVDNLSKSVNLRRSSTAPAPVAPTISVSATAPDRERDEELAILEEEEIQHSFVSAVFDRRAKEKAASKAREQNLMVENPPVRPRKNSTGFA